MIFAAQDEQIAPFDKQETPGEGRGHVHLERAVGREVAVVSPARLKRQHETQTRRRQPAIGFSAFEPMESCEHGSLCSPSSLEWRCWIEALPSHQAPVQVGRQSPSIPPWVSWVGLPWSETLVPLKLSCAR